MKNILHTPKVLTTLCYLLLGATLATPLSVMANNHPTLVDEIEIVRRNQQLFLYLHSNAPVAHQSLETTDTHLTIELEQINLSPTVRTNYLHAPNVDSIIVKQLPNHQIRLEIDGADLSEPIVGFRELSGKTIPTRETVGGFTLEKSNTTVKTTTPSALLIPKVVTPEPQEKTRPTAIATTTERLNNTPATAQKPLIVTDKSKLSTMELNSTSKPTATSLPVPLKESALVALPASSEVEEMPNETEEPVTPNQWEALLLRLVVGATHHLDWCVYGLAGTIAFSLLVSWGLKRRAMALTAATLPVAQETARMAMTPPQNPTNTTNNMRPATLKEALPPQHQRILDRVQRQMEGLVPSIPSQAVGQSIDFKSTPKVPVSQASRQYQQQQNLGSLPPSPKKRPVAEAMPNNTLNQQGERGNQKVVRPWQPERLGTETREAIDTNNNPTASGEAFLESMNAYLDPASQKNIQQGLRNNKLGL